METSIVNGFLKIYSDIKGNIELSDKEIDYLNELLTGFIYKNVGYRFNSNYDPHLLAHYYFNIYRNIKSHDSLLFDVEDYINRFYEMCNNHPLVMNLITTIKWIYSADYDGKLSSAISNKLTSIVVDSIGNKIILRNVSNNNALPEIRINDVDSLEETLENYLNAVSSTDTLYNIFNRPDFEMYTNEEKIKMIFEGTILNATQYELLNLNMLFKKYTSFVTDPVLENKLELKKVGNVFEDELYFKVKKSDFEFETPYCISFMLKDHYYEFPLIRLGVSKKDNYKATIYATQTSHLTPDNKELSKDIKKSVPKTSSFRYYKPNHLISLIMGLGYLHGLGIEEVEVQMIMPLRYYKTIKDKNMSNEEQQDYLQRMINKNINTYYKLISLATGLSAEEQHAILKIIKNEEVNFNNDYLNNLYNLAYDFGQSERIDDMLPIEKRREI